MVLKWEKGRQGTGYLKLPIIFTKFPIPWDVHILKMPERSRIKLHTDPVPNYKVYRLNIVLREPKEGGKFICPSAMINFRRLKYFRPDVMPHSISRIEEGERLVLSIGWCLRESL